MEGPRQVRRLRGQTVGMKCILTSAVGRVARENGPPDPFRVSGLSFAPPIGLWGWSGG
jgi:hypothetical protein